MNKQDKELIWQTIRKDCCFKSVVNGSQHFCKNKFNLNGICSKKYCPLANTKYATIVEKNGMFFLYFKIISKINFPIKMWKKITLSRNFIKAVCQINANLVTWPEFFISKIKLKFVKFIQTIIRSKIKFIQAKQSIHQINRKKIKKTRKIKIGRLLQKELLNRLHMGAYNNFYGLRFFQSLSNRIQQKKKIQNNSEIQKNFPLEILSEIL